MADTPKRIQRKRTKGWKMPPNTVYVGRPTRWGNVFQVGKDGTAEECVARYRRLYRFGMLADKDLMRGLRGYNLACWCPLDQPCHADVLLDIANG